MGKEPVLILAPGTADGGSRKRGRLPFYVLALALTVLALVMLNGMGVFQSARQRQEAPAETSAPPETSDAPLLPPDAAGSGLAVPDPDSSAGTDETERPANPADAVNFEVVVQNKPQTDPALLRWEEFNRQRLEAGYAALQAPLGGFRNSAGQRPDQGVSGPGQATPGTSGSSIMDRELSAVEQQEGFPARSNREDWSSPYRREPGLPFTLGTGTVIPAVLIAGLNSDLPGPMLAQVGQNVFDSASGKHVLIPKGSRLYGVYDARVATGQRRVLVAWNRVVFPDGSSLTLGAEPGADAGGAAGFEDKVNNHYLRMFGSSVLMSLIGGGMAYAQDTLGQSDTDEMSMQDAMMSALAAQLGQTTLTLLQQNAGIKPTLEIRPGYRFNVVLTKDLIFAAPYKPQGSGGR